MARASRGCITAISRNSLLTGNLFLAYNNCEIMFGQGDTLPELVFNRAFIRYIDVGGNCRFFQKAAPKTFMKFRYALGSAVLLHCESFCVIGTGAI